MNIAVDAMGGDHAPGEIVRGALRAAAHFPDIEITLIGDEAKIRPHVTSEERISIIHTEEVIEADDEPVRAVRRKKNSSMVRMAEEVKEGRAAACISAGNTGALMAAGLFVVGRAAGIDRPALAPTLPTLDGRGFVFLDVGANVDAKPEHLQQYALMGHVYAKNVRGVENPRIGLLNVGTEDQKGNETTKRAFALLKETNLHFIGNVEARDLLQGVADVVVADGFAGNVALKTIEGTALALFSLLKQTLTSGVAAKLAAAVLKPKLAGLKKMMDYSEYGGAALFGLNAPVIKAHGSSDANAIFHAIRQAREMVAHDVIGTIRAELERA
ncbi:phosphate acyltransferase PlsX [Geobacillus proteiniphilus]|uniref:Phosphate acyltransferase n=2 Tax=Geobacillus TaxID=129337 RepID=A0A1Q5SKI9_9BACL|nr:MULTISPECIES: phosphate acyltransferase PlsX [Geobacillus]OKO88547.1 Phosphate:acyl-ACP acyltransferase PlsX [Geobacillus proteiniphilus]OPX03688.1 phosphate acyltransferase [Geobacillus sp. LEMMY01]QCK82496.1 phosphate acyltransferase PlsX [Geobacillus kaustophilus NBRC 102445]WMJ18056.1 phosphate acyltransferase PlsX [Geobacillus proteiniphilus]